MDYIKWREGDAMPLTTEQKQMVEDNIKLAYYMAHKFSNIPIEKEDLIQICLEGLIAAAKVFNPEKGFKFATLAVPTIQNTIFHELRSINKWQRLGPVYMEDITYNEPSESMENVEDMLTRKTAIAKVLRSFKGGQREKAAAIMFVRNPYQTQMEIADKAGICQVTVSRGIRVLQKQLRNELTG